MRLEKKSKIIKMKIGIHYEKNLKKDKAHY